MLQATMYWPSGVQAALFQKPEVFPGHLAGIGAVAVHHPDIVATSRIG